MREEAVVFDCQGEALTGVFALPDTACATVGLVMVVGGPQYRAGSHRQFTRLCRALASAGVPALRFDCRGMGDSTGEMRNFEHVHDDIQGALDAISRRLPGLKGVVLWGLCDGASAALMYWNDSQDERVLGLALLNPWARAEHTLARAYVKHYYLQRLMETAFWRKLLSGGVAGRALRDLASNLRAARNVGAQAVPAPGGRAGFLDRMSSAIDAFGGPVLLLLSGRDHTAREFLEYSSQAPQWSRALGAKRVSRVDLPDADHTFSSPDAGKAMELHTLQWVHALQAALVKV